METAPNTAYVWGLFKQNISLSQVVNSSYVLCWAAKWLDSEEIHFSSVNRTSPKKMLKGIHDLLSEADAVVHYNGSRFDVPTLNKEFLLHDMSPPSTYKQIDLLRTARQQFRFTSNKLDYVAQALKVGGKTKHAGFELWVKCMQGDPEAWKTMEEYNINDVAILERVYYKLLPWIKNHPNRGLTDDISGVCPNCGSDKLHRRGVSLTAAGKYQRYQCQDCGTWSRDKKNVAVKDILTLDRN